MFEIKITLEAPELSTAINNLASAMGNHILTIPAVESPKTKKSSNKSAEPSKETVKPEEAPIAAEEISAAVEETPIAEETVIYTLEQVREKLAALSKDGKQAKVKTLIEKHGAAKLSELKPETYAALMKEAEAL
jgi:hypothetical protein